MNVWTDGSSYGYACYVTEDGRQKITKVATYIQSVNGIEAYAIFRALADLPHRDITILSDAQSLVEPLQKAQIPFNDVAGIVFSIRRLCRNRNVKFEYVPREQNKAGRVLDTIRKIPFKCPYCERQKQSPLQLQQHIAAVHGMSNRRCGGKHEDRLGE